MLGNFSARTSFIYWTVYFVTGGLVVTILSLSAALLIYVIGRSDQNGILCNPALPCDMSFDTFFIDPYGDVMPCNGTKDKEVMGNVNEQTWDELWNSPEVEEVRKKVRHCDRNCWMIGSVSPAMHKYIWKPTAWVAAHKVKVLFSKHPYSMYENKIVRDYRDGRITKEELDQCSTCDMCAVVNNWLSAVSMEQLKDKTGEEIVDADIAEQMKK